jgi:hypothetical protein
MQEATVLAYTILSKDLKRLIDFQLLGEDDNITLNWILKKHGARK